MIDLREPYEPRPISFLEMWTPGGWRVKVYGLAYEGDAPGEDLVEAAKARARVALPRPAVTEHRYGLAFLGVHAGRDGDLVFLDWWRHENELVHRVWVGPQGLPAALEDVTASGPHFCAWDLAVIAHERDAWVEHVLANPQGPDVEGYLGVRFEGRV